MSDSVGKISLDLELQSDLNKQISESASKIGEQLKASFQNTDVSKVASNISNTLKATMDKAFNGINTSIESVFNNATDIVSENINIAKENALTAISEVKESVTEMIQTVIAMGKNIKLPINFPTPVSAPEPSNAPVISQVQPRAPPIPKVNTGANLEAVKAQIDNLSRSLDITNAQIEAQQTKLAGLKESYANTFNQERKGKLQEQILKTEEAINKLIAKSDKAGFKLADLDKQFESLNNSAKSATAGVNAVSSSIGKVSETAGKASSNVKKASASARETGRHMDLLGHTARNTGNSFNHMGNVISRSFSKVLRQVFVTGVIYKALRGLISYTGSALMTNQQFVHSLNQIRSNLMVAFMPIYQAALPALNALMSGLATVTAYIATFISAIFGKTYQQSFNAAKGLVAAKTAMGAYGKTAKKAGEEAKGALTGFDEINQLDLDKGKDDDGGGGGSGAPEMVMPDIDVSPASVAGKAIEELVAKTKAVLATIFQPFKNAWMKDGEGVVEEFKRAIEGTKGTLKNFYDVLATPPVQLFAENVARVVLALINLGLKIYTDFILPIIDWFINLLPGAADGLNPILEATRNFINYLSGEGFPIVQAVLSGIIGLALGLKVFNIVLDITSWFKNLATAMGGTWKLMLAHPIALLIAVIVGLIAAFIALYASNENFRNKVNEVWATIKGFLIPIFNALKDTTIYLWNNVFVPLATFLKTIFLAAWKAIIDIATWLWQNVFVPLGNFILWLISTVLVPLGSIIVDVLVIAFRFLKDIATSVWKNVLVPLGDFIITTLYKIIVSIAEVFTYWWENALVPIGNFIANIFRPIIQGLIDVFMWLWKNVLEPLISYMLGGFISGFNVATEGIRDAIGGIKLIFGGLIDFIVGVFTGDWGRAWGGVLDIFKGIFDSLYSAVKTPLNLIIDAVNWVIKGLNKISFSTPDWIPGIGGKNFGVNISSIPKLARGGIIDQPTLSMVGEAGKEAVVPLENNTEWMDKVSAAVANAIIAAMQLNGNNNSNNKDGSDIVLQIDGTTIGRILGPVLDKEKQRIGNNLIVKTT